MTQIAFLALGVAAGLLYFTSVQWTARGLVYAGLTFGVAALIIFRVAALTLMLYLASRTGALPLLMTALGILAGRTAVLRRGRVAS